MFWYDVMYCSRALLKDSPEICPGVSTNRTRRLRAVFVCCEDACKVRDHIHHLNDCPGIHLRQYSTSSAYGVFRVAIYPSYSQPFHTYLHQVAGLASCDLGLIVD